MRSFVSAVVVLFTLSVPAIGVAQTVQVDVKGWASSCTKQPCPPQAVTTYSADGVPAPEKKDLSQLAIAGLRPWNPSYGLVRIATSPEIWVRARVLDVRYCDTAGTGPMPSAGGPQTATTMGMGSGPGCKP